MGNMQTRSAARRFLPGSPFNNLRVVPEVEDFAVQDRVNHDSYGLGRVITKEDGAVTVDFGTRRIRIVSPFHKLAKL